MSAVVGVAGPMVGEREISMVRVREEVSTSLLIAEKYSSVLEIGEMSMTVLEDRIEDVERVEWCQCLDID